MRRPTTQPRVLPTRHLGAILAIAFLMLSGWLPVQSASALDEPILAYASYESTSWEIHLLSADGSRRQLTQAQNYNYSRTVPTWSPDGGSIAYQEWSYCPYPCYPYTDIDLYRTPASGWDPTELTHTDGFTWEAEPAWSPDGSRIAFSLSADSNWSLWVMNADGSAQTRLTWPVDQPDTSTYDTRPAWSPDGTRIAFTRRIYPGGRDEVYVMNADGSGLVNLTRHEATDSSPTWSPDGSQLAFTSQRSGFHEIWIMNADGSSPRQLTQVFTAIDPTWSPDGGTIAFAGPGPSTCSCHNIWTIGADGTGGRNWENGRWESRNPAWRPTGGPVPMPTPAPSTSASPSPAPSWSPSPTPASTPVADVVTIKQAEYAAAKDELRV